MRSILDNFTATLVPLTTLIRSDKRIAKEVAGATHFLLTDAALASPHARPQNIHPAMMHMPRMVETSGVAGKPTRGIIQ
jgi:hypothetical protein